jgi:membrane protease YdiL (CAAX protease family)
VARSQSAHGFRCALAFGPGVPRINERLTVIADASRRSGTALALLLIAWIIVAWIGAWLLFRSLEPRVAAMRSDVGQFAYWTTLKLAVWILPALGFLRSTGRDVTAVLLGGKRPSLTLTRGLAGGLLLVSASAVPRIFARGAPIPPRPVWAQINAVVVAPIAEELAFRGVVLPLLQTGRKPSNANSMTALLFVASHVPGWLFQGRLVEMASRPMGGAVGIFVVGWILGLITQRSGSVAASMVAHAVNNLGG